MCDVCVSCVACVACVACDVCDPYLCTAAGLQYCTARCSAVCPILSLSLIRSAYCERMVSISCFGNDTCLKGDQDSKERVSRLSWVK